MYPSIFGLSSWLVFVCLGILTALLIFRILSPFFKISDDSFTKFALFLSASIFFGLIFAWLFQGLYDLPLYLQGKKDFVLIHRNDNGNLEMGGMTFMGGVVGGVATFMLLTMLFTKQNQRKQVWNMICLAPLCLSMGHCLGRIGCFLGGCCYGSPTDSFLGVDFHLQKPYDLGARYPTQLFESIFLLLLFVSLLIIVFKYKKYGLTCIVYLLAYSIFRFSIEFLRDDPRGNIVLFTPSQWQSVAMLGLGIFLLVYMQVYKKVPFNKGQEKPFDYLFEVKA